jgi:hypothetical protein
MRIELSGHKFTFPQQCACCGAVPQTTRSASATRTTGKKVVHTNTKSWDFPYCFACSAHVQAAAGALGAAGAVVTVALLAAGYVCFGLDQTAISIFLCIAGIGGAIAIFNTLMSKAKAMCSTTCAAVKSAVGYHGWQGACHMFEVLSPDYALAFMLANQNKLLNVRPDVWQWLQANGYGTLPGSQPQSAKRYMT